MIKQAMAMVVMVLAMVCDAGVAAAQDRQKGWLDVNFGVAAAAQGEYTSIRVLTISQEAGGGGVGYEWPRGASFDVGGGYMFSPRLGVGVSLAGTAHEAPVALAVSVPHPLYFNASAEDATVSDRAFTRAEGAWHLHAMAVAAETPRFRVRVFGGPSHFRAEQDIVTSILYDQSFGVFTRTNIVNITSLRSTTRDASAWGAHFGGDASVFFNRIVGVGAVVRVSRGTVEMDDYGGVEDVKVGGVQFGAGLRLRF